MGTGKVSGEGPVGQQEVSLLWGCGDFGQGTHRAGTGQVPQGGRATAVSKGALFMALMLLCYNTVSVSPMEDSCPFSGTFRCLQLPKSLFSPVSSGMEREEVNFHLKKTESHHSPHIFASLFWHEEKGPVSYSCKLTQASPTAKGCHNRDPPVPTGCCKAASPAHTFYFTPTHQAKFLLMSTPLLSLHYHLLNRGCKLHLPQPLTRGRVPPPPTLTCATMWVMSPVLAGSRTVLESLASLEKAFTYCSATEREAAALPCCGETAEAQHEGG